MKSYDIVLTPPGHSEGLPYMYGPKGSFQLGQTLREPTAPTKVDTILIQSLHHGAGRKISTDPMMYRDTNGKATGMDARQIGYILPGGRLSLIGTVAITQAADVASLQAYAASFVDDSGNVNFGIGRQIITIDITNDDVSSVDALSVDQFFTGSVVAWNLKKWLGVSDVDGVTVGNYNQTDDALDTSDDFMFSWAVSTRNALFWIRNRSGAVPQMRWSDGTDTDFTSLDPTADTGNVFGPFALEIEKPFVTGMGVAGPFAVFASKGGDLWAFNSVEVFQPLTPPINGGFEDKRFAGPMAYVGSWLLVPTIDGLLRFDPRILTLTDISPSVHQNATPDIVNPSARQAQAVATGPTQAIAVAPFIGSVENVLYFEMYQDGFFYHVPVSDLGVTIDRAWGAIVTRKQVSGVFTPYLRAYIIAADSTVENWKIFRLDLPTAGWQPGPENMAASSGLRTSMYTPRPPDVSAQVTGVRGYGRGSEENYIEVFLEIDDSGDQFSLGRIMSTGPFALDIPSIVPPGRRYALAFECVIGNNSGVVPYISMPLSIDHRYSPAATSGGPDFITLKFEASGDSANKFSGYRFTDGRSEMDWLMDLGGQVCELQFGDTDIKWKIMVEDNQAELLEQEDGLHSPDYLVTLTCRRLS